MSDGLLDPRPAPRPAPSSAPRPPAPHASPPPEEPGGPGALPGPESAGRGTPADPEPYEEVTHPSFAEQATSFVAVTTHGGVILKGPCPRCGDPMDYPYVSSVVRSFRRRRPEPAAAAERAVVRMICTCSVFHPGRSEGQEGCGAYWNVVLEVGP